MSDEFIVCIIRLWHTRRQGRERRSSFFAFAEQLHQNLSTHRFVSSEEDEFAEQSELQFHRFDLIASTESDSKFCRYFKQLSHFDAIGLFLSPLAFKSPLAFQKVTCPQSSSPSNAVAQNQCARNVDSIMAYLRDTTNLLTNPGLHSYVRADISVLLNAMRLLQRRHNAEESMKSFIVRRYVTSFNGIVLMYPSVPLPNDFDAIRRPWFQRTMENVRKLTITGPYLDVGGAGYVVTLSQIVFETIGSDKRHNRSTQKRRHRKRSQSNDWMRRPYAIVSIDVTHGFFYRMLIESSKLCQSSEKIKCFLFDETGALIAHPSILDTSMGSNAFEMTENGFVKRLNAEHITQKESFVASDILLHRNLVQKKLCQNLMNRKIQRFYQFNTSATEVFGNVINGERSRYMLAGVPGTNLFVTMLNTTEGDESAAFCPCSTVDRVCFNCNRVEPMNCECPCECSMPWLDKSTTLSYQSGDLLDSNDEITDRKINLFQSVDVCPVPIDEYTPKKIEISIKLDVLSACVNYSCELHATQLECLGVIGCEWCSIDVDGETILQSPFCTHQTACFGGILGAITPYGDSDLGAVAIDSMIPSTYAAIGPVIGSITVLCVIVIIAMYCYHNSADQRKYKTYGHQ